MAQFYSPKRKNTKISKKLQITVEKLDHQCQGIAYLENKIIFIPAVLPGEEVAIQLIEQKKTFAKARLHQVIRASEERVSPVCEHFQHCGGCQIQYLDGSRQLAYKQQALADRLRGLTATTRWAAPIVSAPWQYRRRARVGVRVDRQSSRLVLGFRQRGSNQLLPIKQCAVLVAPFHQIFQSLQRLLEGVSIRQHIGHLEFIQAREGNIVVIRHMKAFTLSDITKLRGFQAQHQILFFTQADDGVIKQLDGLAAHALSYCIDAMTLHFRPGDFIQVNDPVNQQMVAQAVEWLALDPGDRVLDLFCGIGNFSLAIAREARQVIGVEGVSEMVDRARRNCREAGLTNGEFFHCDLEQSLSEQPWFNEGVDKVLLDPARDGAANICRQLNTLNPKQIVYVSCNPASLARDTEILVSQGYRLERLGVIDMFPQTGHLESMSLFVKAGE